MRAVDNQAKGKVLMGGEAVETESIALERGAPQGEVMSPIRFIAWMNILMEVLYNDGESGYAIRGEERKYVGQAFCDDGCFVAESNEELRKISEKSMSKRPY